MFVAELWSGSMMPLSRRQQGRRVPRVGRSEPRPWSFAASTFLSGGAPGHGRGLILVVPVFRHRLRSGLLRLRSGWLPILQTAVAACLAWLLAVLILGLERPTFAPIAAVIVLGLAVGERLRRALELTLAVAFGVAMADLLLSVVGVGGLQAGVFVVLAMGLTVFLSAGDLGVKEAAISAMIIMFTYTPSAASFPIDRFLEALIGGGTAPLINALLPVNPERMVEDAAY